MTLGRLYAADHRSSRVDPGPQHATRMWHAEHMSKMIQVRHVPDRLHKELVKRAAARGQTLSDFVQSLLEREVERPAAEEVFARVSRAAPVNLRGPAAALVREERSSRSGG